MDKYKISLGKSNMTKIWEQKEVTWDELVKRLTKTTRTKESFDDYMKMSKDDQGQIKASKGGFVGGALIDGLRRRNHVACHSLITLDLDECPPGILDDLELLCPYQTIVYSTHKHSEKFPRLRLVMPLSKEVSEEEYEPLARKVASKCGVNMTCFDRTTYEATRLMYFPTTSKDGQFIGLVIPGKIVDVDEELSSYKDWHNVDEWPRSEKETSIRRSEVSKIGDPRNKNNIIGQFCSVFTIDDVIEKFLSDVYEPGTIPDRYTFIGGSTSNGARVYQNGTFLFSDHQTDPVHGQGCANAFDLVRIHKFGHLDVDLPEGTKAGDYPSYRACKKWAESLPELNDIVNEARNKRIAEKARKDFSDFVEGDDSWMEALQRHPENHKILETYDNYFIILNNDPRLKGLVGINQFSTYPEVLHKAPWKRADDSNKAWTDNDDAQLFGYINKYYGLKNNLFLSKAMEGWMSENAFDPVKEFIESEKWDGLSRVESYFIDYLGADDNLYVRTVTRKMFVAAVSRIYQPGCKFDYLVTLVGKQGIGKSLACRNLAGENGQYFSDSISGAANLNAKEVYESLRGQWIVEWGELAALKKGEREQVKLFLSKQTDTYRGAYLRRTTAYPRRCIFIGTTNDDTFLNDATGARRFLIVDCHGHGKKNAWDITEAEVRQLWAEAKVMYDKGENIMDLSDVARMALEQQEAHTEENIYIGQLEDFLETPIPADWQKKSIGERQQFYRSTHDFVISEGGEGMVKRDIACAQEFWVEYLGNPRGTSDNIKSRIINDAFNRLGWTETRVVTTKGYKGHRGHLRPKSQPK